MHPTTSAKTSKIQHKHAAAQHAQAQKVQMVHTVNEAIQQYSTSTGKSQKKAQQEIFTIDHLSKRKRALCPRDIFMRDKLQEINKGAFLFHLH